MQATHTQSAIHARILNSSFLFLDLRELLDQSLLLGGFFQSRPALQRIFRTRLLDLYRPFDGLVFRVAPGMHDGFPAAFIARYLAGHRATDEFVIHARRMTSVTFRTRGSLGRGASGSGRALG